MKPLWEVFETRSGRTCAFAEARDLYRALVAVSTALDVPCRGLDADLVPVEQLDRLPGNVKVIREP